MLTNEQIIELACMSIPELEELLEAVTTTLAVKMVHQELEGSDDGQPTELTEWQDFDGDC